MLDAVGADGRPLRTQIASRPVSAGVTSDLDAIEPHVDVSVVGLGRPVAPNGEMRSMTSDRGPRAASSPPTGATIRTGRESGAVGA